MYSECIHLVLNGIWQQRQSFPPSLKSSMKQRILSKQVIYRKTKRWEFFGFKGNWFLGLEGLQSVLLHRRDLPDFNMNWFHLGLAAMMLITGSINTLSVKWVVTNWSHFAGCHFVKSFSCFNFIITVAFYLAADNRWTAKLWHWLDSRTLSFAYPLINCCNKKLRWAFKFRALSFFWY